MAGIEIVLAHAFSSRRCTGWHGSADTSRTLLLTTLPSRSIRFLHPLQERILNLFMRGMPRNSRFPSLPTSSFVLIVRELIFFSLFLFLSFHASTLPFNSLSSTGSLFSRPLSLSNDRNNIIVVYFYARREKYISKVKFIVT